MGIELGFKSFCKAFRYLTIKELIEFYSVFGGIKSTQIKPDNGLLENIEILYLQNFHTIKKHFLYTQDVKLQSKINTMLIKLARGDRKRFSIYKDGDISQIYGKRAYKMLFDKEIIKQELSREKPLRKVGQKYLKKEYKNYAIEDKIHFCQESTRFWFNFIAPNIHLIEAKKYDEVLEYINIHIEKHTSLTFELLSLELIKRSLLDKSIISSGSYWSKKHEFDVLVYTRDEQVIAGETKWKNKKICKNVLNLLQRKCKNANLGVTKYALFSKSGFSKELLALQNESLMLFGLDDFKRLYDDR